MSAHEAMESAGATTAMGHPRTVVIRHLLPFEMWGPPNASPDGPPPAPPLLGSSPSQSTVHSNSTHGFVSHSVPAVIIDDIE